jgi:membrane protein
MVSGGLEAPYTHVSNFQNRVIALRIAHLIIKRFERGEAPLQLKEIAIHLRIYPALAEKITRQLCETRLISAVDMNGVGCVGYQPGQDIHRLTIYRIIDALDNEGSAAMDFSVEPEYAKLTQALTALNEIIKSAPANHCLKDI